MRLKLLHATFWLALIGILWTLDTLTKIQVWERSGFSVDYFRLIAEQATSAAGVLAMIPFVAWWMNHFPIRRGAPISTTAGHILGSVIFSLGHYTVMIALRKLAYFLNELTYGWPASLVSNLVFEYQKDIKIYLGIVIIITVYRMFLGGENRLQVRPKSAQKILVQTGTGETVLGYDQIDFLESARNYVVVHAAEREYLVRNTMTGLLEMLAASNFARSHRSFAVNLDKVAQIKATDSGHMVHLDSGREIPLSRSFRDTFRERLTGDSVTLPTGN